MPDDDAGKKFEDRTVPLHELSQRKAPRAFGGYELRGELGRGGMGVVYRAQQLTLKRTVALKMLTGDYAPDDVLRFRAEAEMAAGLQHPNIVHIHEVGEEDGVPFFSMEYVEGGTLSDWMLRGLPPPKEVAEMMVTLSRAVHYAHRQGVVHRDLKPGNILLGAQGEIKIADFGIAKRLDGEGSMTLSGAVMGTPVYMAPEQAGGQSRKVGPAADVYSLGALLYHLLTGRPPFLPDES
ncbi:MAG: serine/threonine-protein kinase, partial [Luteolibacter sp.]